MRIPRHWEVPFGHGQRRRSSATVQGSENYRVELTADLLLEGSDDDAAGAAALAAPAPSTWICGRRCWRGRAKTDPVSTLPYYQQLVDDVLVRADRQNYRTAERLLREMRDAASTAEVSHEFERVLAAGVERNRRRPSFFEEFHRAGSGA